MVPVGEHERAPVDPDERAEIDLALSRWGGAAPIKRVERLRGLTNRSYRVVTDAGSLAVRLPGLGTDAYIDRDAERHNAQVAATLGVGAPVLYADRGAMVCAFIEGRVLSPAILRSEPDTLARVGRLLRVVHDSDQPFVSRLDPATIISDHRSGLVEVPTGVDDLISLVQRIDPPVALVPCHGDPWPENFIDTGHRLHLVDWEYSGLSEPAWDLANLAVEAGLGRAQRENLVDAYTMGVADPRLTHRIDELDPVTDLLWGLWALTQERDGNRAEDFGAYGRSRLDRAQRAAA